MMRIELEVSVPGEGGNVVDLTQAFTQSLDLPFGAVVHRLSVEEDDA